MVAIVSNVPDKTLNEHKQAKKRIRKLIRKEIGAALNQVKEELDEHRETINEGTNELQSNYGYIQLLEQKIDLLAEKVEAIARAIHLNGEPTLPLQRIELSDREIDLFIILYTAPAALSYQEIAEKMLTSDFLVGSYVAALVEKGIPVIKRYFNSTVLVALDSSFREQQAKYNIVKLVKEASLLAYIEE